MNVEIGTEAPIFLFWEYLFQIFGILSFQCMDIGQFRTSEVRKTQKQLPSHAVSIKPSLSLDISSCLSLALSLFLCESCTNKLYNCKMYICLQK
jgi:hypothetical protein